MMDNFFSIFEINSSEAKNILPVNKNNKFFTWGSSVLILLMTFKISLKYCYKWLKKNEFSFFNKNDNLFSIKHIFDKI